MSVCHALFSRCLCRDYPKHNTHEVCGSVLTHSAILTLLSLYLLELFQAFTKFQKTRMLKTVTVKTTFSHLNQGIRFILFQVLFYPLAYVTIVKTKSYELEFLPIYSF